MECIETFLDAANILILTGRKDTKALEKMNSAFSEIQKTNPEYRGKTAAALYRMFDGRSRMNRLSKNSEI